MEVKLEQAREQAESVAGRVDGDQQQTGNPCEDKAPVSFEDPQRLPAERAQTERSSDHVEDAVAAGHCTAIEPKHFCQESGNPRAAESFNY